jgi:hypothetical protein
MHSLLVAFSSASGVGFILFAIDRGLQQPHKLVFVPVGIALLIFAHFYSKRVLGKGLNIFWRSPQQKKGGLSEKYERHKITLRFANLLTLFGILIGLFTYWSGWLARNDWRGIGVGAGLMVFLPCVYIVAANAARGTEGIKEGLSLFAASQNTPTSLFYSLLALLFLAGALAGVSLLRAPP